MTGRVLIPSFSTAGAQIFCRKFCNRGGGGVVVVTRPLPRDRGVAENHGAPEAGQVPKV